MKRTLIIAILTLACAFCAMGQQRPNITYQTVTDIPYHPGVSAYADEKCKLDIYYPEGGKDFATIVWYHGGGIIEGRKEIPEALKNSGMCIVGVGYRFVTEVPVEDVIDDTAASIAWVFDNIESYGGSKDKIFVAGHSAGGYLIDMAVLDKSYLAKYGVDADQIAGAFPFSAQVITHYNVRSASNLGPLEPLIDSTAPLAHMRVLPMPMYVLSGDRELELYGRYEEQAYFWRMMKLVGNDQVYLYEFAGFDHGSMPTPGFPLMKRQIRNILAGKPYSR